MQKKSNQNDFANAPLLKVEQRKDGTQAVSARELYEFLEVKEKFTEWFDRMKSYGFEDGSDFTKVFLEKQKNSKGGRPATDYALTLDCAKQIAMLQRNEKGDQARRYFIECEKQLRASLTPAEMIL